MTCIRFHPEFHARVEKIHLELKRITAPSEDRLKEILEELTNIHKEISLSLQNPNVHNPKSLQELQSAIDLFLGTVQQKLTISILHKLTDRAINLWLKPPLGADERKLRVDNLRKKMQSLTKNHRFPKDDRRFIELFDACVSAVEKAPFATQDKSFNRKNRVISIEEVSRKKIAKIEEDPVAMAEILYPMAELVYHGKYDNFFDHYQTLSPETRQKIDHHTRTCAGELIAIARSEKRNKTNELRIAMGIIGYANTLLGTQSQDGGYYPSALDLYQMFMEVGELSDDED